MFRKFLKRSIPFLVAALVLIGTVVVPVKAAFFEPDSYLDNFFDYYSFVDFYMNVYDVDGNKLNFTFPGTICKDQDQFSNVVYTGIGSGSASVCDYLMYLNYEKYGYPSYPHLSEFSYFHDYYKHNISFWADNGTDSEEYIPYSFEYYFDDFIVPVRDFLYGSSRFRLYIPEGWTYTVSYDYYYVYPQVYDVHYTTNIMSEKHEQYFKGRGSGEHCELLREYDYELMVDMGCNLDSYVFVTNAQIWLNAPADYDGTPIAHYFYAGYTSAEGGLDASKFFTANDVDFTDTVIVEKIVEVPVFDVGITNFLTTGVGGFLDADIFGTFSIGDLLAILISVFFVVYLLRLLK